MSQPNELASVEGQLVGMPLAGPESFSQQQLDYLKAAMGIDETVLWEGTLGATATNIGMSESVKHFERLKVFIQCKTNSIGRCKIIREIEPTFTESTPISLNYLEAYDRASSTTTMNMIYLQFTNETTASLLGGSKWVNNTFTNSITTYDFNIVKIVGIHRIAGGN